MYTKQEVYSMLTENALWVCFQLYHTQGNETLFASTNGVLKLDSKNWRGHARKLQREVVYTLNIEREPLSIFPAPYTLAKDVYWQAHRVGKKYVVFEGFAHDIDPKLGYGEAIHDVAIQLRKEGFIVLLSDIQSWIYWNNKMNFRQLVQTIYGMNSVPSGYGWSYPSVYDIKCFAERHFHNKTTTLVLKTPGRGGKGNILLTSYSDVESLSESVLDVPWVVVEEWQDWTISPCTSFFSSGKSKGVYLEMCNQNIEGSSFKGGTSFISLSAKDKQTLIEYQKPVANHMFFNGIQGFVGIDTILCSSGSQSPLILPDSQLKVMFVEANPRCNGHNEERLFIQQVAKRENVASERIDHMRLSIKEIDRLSHMERERVWNFFAEQLHGYAVPFTRKCLVRSQVYFMLGATYNLFLLFGIDITVEQCLQVYQYLQKKELCK